ncbi:MAG: carbohydrate kinase family protein [Bacilli bacterium]|nr:carbohydrate kinase family protein [Bacilli bacterium]
MARILVCGLLNVETTLNVHSFPVEYSPIEYPFNQVGNFIGGVGFNVAKSLRTLGDDVHLCSYLGNDLAAQEILFALRQADIDSSRILFEASETPLSVVLYDQDGDRKIYCDLKDVQEKAYPSENIIFREYDLVVLANANFSRPLLFKAQEAGCKVATDVQAIQDIHDPYNTDYMAHSDILFFSNVCIEGREEEFARQVYQTYHNEILGIGLGKQGALLYIGAEDRFYFSPAKNPRPVVSTVGAGDALFSCFVHFIAKGFPVEKALDLATLYAGYKVGEKGASVGFLSEKELMNL